MLLRAFDTVACPVVFLSGHLLKLVRRAGVQRLPLSKRALLSVGVLPIRDHYYEPLFNPRELNGQLRMLNGIDWNVDGQTALLKELLPFVQELPANWSFCQNAAFGPGDADIWYGMIRRFKPRRIVEVGSGYSTRIAQSAIAQNGVLSTHICIEPYEMPWLESSGVTQVIRQKVEDVDRKAFALLKANDILFIDSSHVIRPQGDVLTEILDILPILERGVIVHFHDIFSPHDYPQKWIVDEVRLWNEQYLLEAFLTENAHWSVLLALNQLQHSGQFASFPFVTSEPGSFYIRKN